MLLRSVLILVALGHAGHSVSASSQVDVSGVYASNWEDVTLVQEGRYVHGTYVCCGGGTIEGRIYEGRVIRYRWKQASGSEGEGVWEINGSRLEGTWGTAQSDDDGGRWDLEKKAALAN